MNGLDQLIPEGYKTSEVGIIPERWNAVLAKEVVEFFGGYGFSSRLASNDGTKWLKIANVGINEIKWGAVSYLPEYLLQSFKEYSLAENDVVMALTRPLLGDQLKVAKIESKDLPALLNQRVAKLKPKSSNNLNYIYYSIQREDFIAAMNLAMAGTDPPNIGTNALGKIFVAIPEDEKEQIAIANALSDVDALLTELEKLIAKKQSIKTAAMQQLLTGKTRLPQFATYTEGAVEGKSQGQPKDTKPSELGEIPEDWDVDRIGDVSTVDPQNLGAGTSPDYEFEYISLEQVDNGKLIGTTQYKFQDAPSRARRVLKHNDVLLSTVRPNLKSHLFIRDKVKNLICSTGFAVIRSGNIKLCSEFIFHHLFCHVINNQIEMLISGSNYPAINSNDVKNLKIAVPPIEEQTAIATILSDMDNEIQTLEQRLAKTRQVKQGMMQELLTGRTRLPF
ncbi:hypothetical protein BM528_13645 [Alteromonas sp. RW2A1]|uniref:restriction endonuclease subunit S n=1 Tax=Alteromonas sp. RW2A1 TaxID=1917158 RepID=UPI000903B22E|nr:restriction endonuclease subunit S [Alteromonas sp. RW2A1]APE06684.1 hypothetical protein BM528_13645 [Alteromonas sp. RW2A1]